MAHPLLINVFTALKGSQFEFLFAITAAGVVSCGGPKKSPHIIHGAGYIFFLVLWDQRGYSENSEIYYRLRFIF